MRRVTFYLEDDEYRQLKVILAIYGMSASEWLRHGISTYVNDQLPKLPKDEHGHYKITPRTPPPPPRPHGFDDEMDLQ